MNTFPHTHTEHNTMRLLNMKFVKSSGLKGSGRRQTDNIITILMVKIYFSPKTAVTLIALRFKSCDFHKRVSTTTCLTSKRYHIEERMKTIRTFSRSHWLYCNICYSKWWLPLLIGQIPTISFPHFSSKTDIYFYFYSYLHVITDFIMLGLKDGLIL